LFDFVARKKVVYKMQKFRRRMKNIMGLMRKCLEIRVKVKDFEEKLFF